MCDTCGCGQPDNVKITIPGEELKPGEHTHSHSHTHTHGDHDHHAYAYGNENGYAHPVLILLPE